jgi:hypothetical protein
MGNIAEVPGVEYSRATFADLERYVAELKYAKLSTIQLQDPNSSRNSPKTFGKYDKETVIGWLSSPEQNKDRLLELSIYLASTSSQYSRLLSYLANMPVYAYILTPANGDIDTSNIDVDKYIQCYKRALHAIEVMNLKHEFSKILNIAFRDDVFFGYVYETSDSFTIQHLDPKYCKIDTIDDGVYNFSFDFSYFRSKEDQLPFYAPEFQDGYEAYKEDSKMRWQHLDAKKTICIKIREDTLAPIPPFVALFSTLVDINEYRSIAKSASESNNYKVLTLKIPVDKDGNLLLPLDLCKEFYNRLSDELPPNIGLTLSPMEIQDFKFESAGALKETDIVARAESAFWRDAGVSNMLFGGGESPSSSSLEISIRSDEEIVFRVLRQLERWTNRRLKNLSGKYRFKFKLLDVTRFNQSDMLNMYKTLGQYGMPVRLAIMAIAGYEPSETYSMGYLENMLLGLSDNEIPLKSSNTQSLDSEGGRPTNKSKGEGLTDAGEQTKEDDENAAR